MTSEAVFRQQTELREIQTKLFCESMSRSVTATPMIHRRFVWPASAGNHTTQQTDGPRTKLVLLCFGERPATREPECRGCNRNTKRVHTFRDGQRQIREDWGPATENPIRFVLTRFRTFAAESTEVKDVSNAFERRRPRERHTIDHQGSPSAVHRAGPEGFLVERNLETNFPKLSATFADHMGESQFSPSSSLSLSLPLPLPLLDAESPSGVEATQAVRITVIIYPRRKTERGPKKGDTSSWPTSKMKQTVTKQCTNATDILHSVQIKNKLLLCVPSSGETASTSVPSVSKTPVHHRRSTPTIDAIDAARPPNHQRRHRRHRSHHSTPSKPSKRRHQAIDATTRGHRRSNHARPRERHTIDTKDLPVQSTELDQKVFLLSQPRDQFSQTQCNIRGSYASSPCKDQDIRHRPVTERRVKGPTCILLSLT